QPSLEDYFLEHPPRSAREAQDATERLTGIRRGLSQVRAFLKKKVGLRWRKVGTVPAKGDHDEQKAFLDNELRPRLDEAKQGKRTVLFVDAAHFVFGPFLDYVPGAAVRARAFGPQALQRPGGLGRRDAPGGPGVQPRLHQCRERLRAVARGGDRRAEGAD